MSRDLDQSEVMPVALDGRAGGLDALTVEVRVREAVPEATASRGSTPVSERAIRLLVLVLVMGVSGVYTILHIGKGWVPADDGTLAQSALRVLGGQLPHRDFAEIYSGGLSCIHALAFRAFGVNLMSLRICVFLFFMAWLPAVYSIALRFTAPLGAGMVTLLAVAWSYPNYPAAMPSWYNLFLATYGAAAFLRYLDGKKARWLYCAGICGGLSILVKVIGAYYVAGALLFIAYLEQGEHASSQDGKGWAAYRVFSAGALLLFGATVIYFFRARLGGGEVYQFLLPTLALVGAILIEDRKVRAKSASARFRALFRLLVPFVVGVLTPIAVFLVPYARSGAIGAFFAGVTASAVAHSIALGIIRPIGVEGCVYALALLGLLVGAMFLREFQSKVVSGGVAVALMVLLYVSSRRIVSGVWFSAATLTPLVVLFGVAIVLAKKKSNVSTLQKRRVMLLISLAGLCSLVQFPFAAPIYLAYCLPLTLLALAAIVTTAQSHSGRYVLSAVMAFYLLFAVVRVVPGYIYELTHMVGTLDALQLQRAGGLRIESATNLDALVHFVQQRAPNGLLYAGNDCPSFYFLSGLKNITRDDGGAPAQEVLRALESSDVKVVVINEQPFFPGAETDPAVRAEVMRRFPQSVRVGIPRMGLYTVFWRP
ncbi:MAG: hypothetical protein WCB53_21980 [Terriglobales bacterium]